MNQLTYRGLFHKLYQHKFSKSDKNSILPIVMKKLSPITQPNMTKFHKENKYLLDRDNLKYEKEFNHILAFSIIQESSNHGAKIREEYGLPILNLDQIVFEKN